MFSLIPVRLTENSLGYGIWSLVDTGGGHWWTLYTVFSVNTVLLAQCSDLEIQTTHGLLGVREMCSRVAMKKYTWTHMNRSSAC